MYKTSDVYLVIAFFIFVLTTSISAQSKGANDKNVSVVKYVDLNKYSGLWYEIAKIPNTFQKSCACCTTAEYYLEKDGSIKVINSCNKSDGERKRTEGVAKIVSGAGNAKLEVSFFSILGIRPIWGDYWIIGLGDDYSYAVIGTPDRKYGWILSRTAKLPDSKLQEAVKVLKNNGYNPDDFEFTLQK